MQKQKGFTIIELLVVVAIIAVLTGIVVANITVYTNRAKNATITGSLSDIYKNSVIYLSENGAFTAWPDPVYPNFSEDINNIPNANLIFYGDDKGYVAGQPPTRWCFCIDLSVTSDTPPNSTYCIDSTGYAKETTTACLGPGFTARCKRAGLFPLAQSGFCTD